MRVPLFATRSAIEPLLPRVKGRIREVLDSGRYILVPEREAFEAELAGYLGAGHCIGVANGTDALTVALRALGVGDGDEVVVPAVSFYATAEAVVNAGARPVFADVDSDTWCLTAATVEPAITPRTAAIVPVHLFGNPAPMRELTELARSRSQQRIRVLEDAAQAIGARIGGEMAGTLGDAASFSFYPSKNLGAFGAAGAIATGSVDLARTCRAESGYHLYVVSSPARDALARGLAEREIENRIYCTPPLHKQPGLAHYAPDRSLPGAERFATDCVALPMGPALARDQVQLVVRSVEEALQQAPVT